MHVPTPPRPTPGSCVSFLRPSQVLAHYARHRASDSKFVSPFAYSAFQAGLAFMGGKLDDITVVIASVHQLPAAPASKM